MLQEYEFLCSIHRPVVNGRPFLTVTGPHNVHMHQMPFSMSTYTHYLSSMTLEVNDAAFFDTGGDLLYGFDELDILDIVCMCISNLSFYFGRPFNPLALV